MFCIKRQGIERNTTSILFHFVVLSTIKSAALKGYSNGLPVAVLGTSGDLKSQKHVMYNNVQAQQGTTAMDVMVLLTGVRFYWKTATGSFFY